MFDHFVGLALKGLLVEPKHITLEYLLALVQDLQARASYQSVINSSQPAFSCSKLTAETLEQGTKYNLS